MTHISSSHPASVRENCPLSKGILSYSYYLIPTIMYVLRAAVVQEVKKSFSNQKVASSIPCRSVLEQGTEPLIAPDVQCAISVNVKMCIHCKSHICKSL